MLRAPFLPDNLKKIDAEPPNRRIYKGGKSLNLNNWPFSVILSAQSYQSYFWTGFSFNRRIYNDWGNNLLEKDELSGRIFLSAPGQP